MLNKTENKKSAGKKEKAKILPGKSLTVGNKDLKASFMALAIELAAHGFTAEQIEDYCGSETGTIERYFKKYPDFRQAFKNAEAEQVINIENALIKRAAGYESVEKHVVWVPLNGDETEINSNENGFEPGMKIKEVKYVKKFIPADSSSALLYLYNRRPDRWSRNPNQAGSNETIEEILEKRKRAYREATENL